MKLKTKLKISFVCSIGLITPMFGHEVPVHREITVKAEESTYAHSIAYNNFLDAISSDRPRIPQPGQNGAVQSLTDGSAHEDDPSGNDSPSLADGGG